MPAGLFLDRRQFDVAHVTRPAGFPNKVELESFEWNVGVNRSGIGFHDSRFDAADHVNRARLPFDFDLRARRNRHDEIDAILFSARAHVDLRRRRLFDSTLTSSGSIGESGGTCVDRLPFSVALRTRQH